MSIAKRLKGKLTIDGRPYWHDIRIDKTSHSLLVMSDPTARLYDGKTMVYFNSREFEPFQELPFLFRTPENVVNVHAVFGIWAEKNGTFSFYREPTVTHFGFPVANPAPINMNQNVNCCGGSILTIMPTITDMGELIAKIHCNGFHKELILARDTTYYSITKNESAKSNWFDIDLKWYERDPKTDVT